MFIIIIIHKLASLILWYELPWFGLWSFSLILLLFQWSSESFRWGIASRWRTVRAFEIPEPNFTAETTELIIPMYSERAARTSGAHQRRCCSHTHYSHLSVHFMLESVRFCIIRSPILFKWDEGTSSFLCQLVIYAQHALMRLSSHVFWSSCKNHTNRVKCSYWVYSGM